MTSIIPTGDNILIEVCESPEDMNSYISCGIISVQAPLSPFSPGDKVFFQGRIGQTLIYKGKEHMIISYKDVLGKIIE